MLNIILQYLGIISIIVGGGVVLFFGGLGNSTGTFIFGFGMISIGFALFLQKVIYSIFKLENIYFIPLTYLMGIIIAALFVKFVIFK